MPDNAANAKPIAARDSAAQPRWDVDLCSYAGDVSQLLPFSLIAPTPANKPAVTAAPVDGELANLRHKLSELGYPFPEGHLERFLSYAKSGHVVGIRRPWPEDLDALAQQCTVPPKDISGATVHLELVLAQLRRFAKLLAAIAGNAASPSTLTLTFQTGAQPAAGANAATSLSHYIQEERLILPLDQDDFTVSTTDAAEMKLLTDWVVTRFARVLVWDSADALAVETPAVTPVVVLRKLLKGLLLGERTAAPDKTVARVSKQLDKWLTSAKAQRAAALADKKSASDAGDSEPADAQPHVGLGAGLSDSDRLHTAESQDSPAEPKIFPPRVTPDFAGRVASWGTLTLTASGEDANDRLPRSVRVPLDIRKPAATATPESPVGWTEGYHYYCLPSSVYSYELPKEFIALNAHFNRGAKEVRPHGFFRPIEPADSDLVAGSTANRYQAGALVFAPEWHANADAPGRMSIHVIESDAEKTRATKDNLSDTRLEFWRIGRRSAVVLAGYLASQSYLYIEHAHSAGFGFAKLTSAWSFFSHEWNELRVVDLLKSLGISVLAGGAGVATVALGGAPLIIGLVGMGASIALDPFAARITDPSKLTATRAFMFEDNRLRTKPDPRASASKFDVVRKFVKSVEETLPEGWTAEPQDELIDDKNRPDDDVKDVGKLIRRAYVHTTIVRENLEKLYGKVKVKVTGNQVQPMPAAEWQINAAHHPERYKILGESWHHIEKSWRYLGPAVIFASAAYDVYLRIAQQWAAVYPDIEAACISRIYALQASEELLDPEKVADKIISWFGAPTERLSARLSAWWGFGNDDKKRITAELRGLRAVIDPVTGNKVVKKGDGTVSGVRVGYTAGGNVGSTLPDWLANWDYQASAPAPVGSPEENLDALGDKITKWNNEIATHLKTWDVLDDVNKTIVAAQRWEDALAGSSSSAAIRAAKEQASNPTYAIQTRHKWTNWWREKTPGQKLQAGLQKLFGFGLSFGGPLLTQNADRPIKIAITASSRAFYLAGKKVAKFAVSLKGVKGDMKQSKLLTTRRTMAVSKLKSKAAQSEGLDDEENFFNEDLLNDDLLKSGASFVGTSLIRKVGYRMTMAAASLQELNSDKGAQQKDKLNGSMDDMVGFMRYLYEYHHHMDKLEFYLMGLLTYLSMLGDEVATYEGYLFAALNNTAMPVVPTLSEPLDD